MGYNYDEISKLYDDVREADLRAVEFLIDTGKIAENSRVLEIGCGTGNYLKLVKELSRSEIWGVDLSHGMLEKAGEKCKDAILLKDDAVELSKVGDGLFDLVYMVDVIHHIKDIKRMFENINRVLKQNGMIIIFTDSYQHIKNRLTTKYFPETLEEELKRYQDTPEIVQCLSEKGFKEIQCGTLETGIDSSFGPKLIETALKKGYSMFGLISDDAIARGIDRIKADMQSGPIIYHQRAPYITAVTP